MRKARTARVPRTRAGGEWTEAAFWSFVRSGLRTMSVRWPPRKQAELAARKRYTGSNKRQKWEYQCRSCGCYFKRTQVQVDHIEPCGSLRSFEEIGGFARRLFCEADGFQVLCTKCHEGKHKCPNANH